MALNFLHPNALIFRYTVDALEHKMTLPCEVVSGGSIGADPASVLLSTRDAGTVNMVSAVENFMAVLADLYYETVTFDNWELNSYPVNSNDATFITGYTPVTTTTGAITTGDTKRTRYLMFTFRTFEGGLVKINPLETWYAFDDQVGYGSLDSNQQAFVDYLLSDDSWVKGRDGGHILSFLRMSGGQNERTWRQRFRP